MRNILLLIFVCIACQLNILAQHKSEPEYINYSSVIKVVADFVKAADTVLWKQSMHSLRTSAGLLKEDVPVHIPRNVASGKKEIRDEEIYSKRKSSVMVIGRLQSVGGTNVNFDIMGTGFFITKEGCAVTNRHVVADLLQTQASNNDLVYFIITEDRKAYALDKLLIYSLNNDLAVFSIISNGRKFDPIPIGQPAMVGAPVFCISHPAGELYYFSKGIVARNLVRDSATLGTAYSGEGKTPLRMEITADYGGGSSGGPVMDRFGNLVGIIATTNTIFLHQPSPGSAMHPQMVIKSTIPVKALSELLK